MNNDSTSTIKIMGIAVSPLQSNCYLICCTKAKECVVVDPGDEPDRINAMIKESGCKPVLLINTHAHGDHIGANRDILEQYNIPLAIHENETHMLTDPDANLSSFLGAQIVSPEADILLKDGDEQKLADNSIKVLLTPGHSPGGISLLIENHLIAGDALFRGSIGRTDLPGGSHETLIQAIKEKILTLPDDTLVYPGHGPVTTVGEERQTNPFLQ